MLPELFSGNTGIAMYVQSTASWLQRPGFTSWVPRLSRSRQQNALATVWERLRFWLNVNKVNTSCLLLQVTFDFLKFEPSPQSSLNVNQVATRTYCIAKETNEIYCQWTFCRYIAYSTFATWQKHSLKALCW